MTQRPAGRKAAAPRSEWETAPPFESAIAPPPEWEAAAAWRATAAVPERQPFVPTAAQPREASPEPVPPPRSLVPAAALWRQASPEKPVLRQQSVVRAVVRWREVSPQTVLPPPPFVQETAPGSKALPEPEPLRQPVLEAGQRPQAWARVSEPQPLARQAAGPHRKTSREAVSQRRSLGRQVVGRGEASPASWPVPVPLRRQPVEKPPLVRARAPAYRCAARVPSVAPHSPGPLRSASRTPEKRRRWSASPRSERRPHLPGPEAVWTRCSARPEPAAEASPACLRRARGRRLRPRSVARTRCARPARYGRDWFRATPAHRPRRCPGSDSCRSGCSDRRPGH